MFLRDLLVLLLVFLLAAAVFVFVIWQEERRSAFGPGSIPMKSHAD